MRISTATLPTTSHRKFIFVCGSGMLARVSDDSDVGLDVLACGRGLLACGRGLLTCGLGVGFDCGLGVGFDVLPCSIILRNSCSTASASARGAEYAQSSK